jgi:hypothetical protein
MDFEAFERNVYELAANLRATPVGESIDDYQKYLGHQIAQAINTNRDELRAEYQLESSTDLVDRLQQRLGTIAVQSDEDTREGLSALEWALREDIEHRRKIAEWLVPVIPKMEKTQTNYRRVIKSLLNQHDLVYTEDDMQTAEEVMNPPRHAHLEREIKKTSVDELEDYELTIVAEGLLKILAKFARQGQRVRQVDMYSQPDFIKVVRLVSPDVPVRQALHTAWGILTAFFEDEDPDYQLFSVEGKGFSGNYILNDPDLVEGIWGTEDDTAEQQPADAEEETERVRPYQGRIVRITRNKLILDSGDYIPLEDDVQRAAAQRLLDRGADFISTGRLSQEISEELRQPRSAVEEKARELLKSLGPNYLERRLNRKKNKALVRIRPNARGVIQPR